MDIKKRIGPYLVEVWETNKGHTLGLYKWRVAELEPQTGTYVTIAKHTRFQTWDAAIVEAFLAIPDNPKGYTYPEFIAKYFPNDQKGGIPPPAQPDYSKARGCLKDLFADDPRPAEQIIRDLRDSGDLDYLLNDSEDQASD